MSAEHLGRLSRDGFDFDAHLLALARRLHLLVVDLDRCHYTQLDELLEDENGG